MREYISEVEPGDKVEVKGWIHEIRDLGGIVFLLLRDRSDKIQIKIEENEGNEDMLEIARNISRESVVSIKGKVEKEERAPSDVEIVPTSLDVLNEAERGLPLDPSGKVKSELSNKIDNRHLDLRSGEGQAIFELRSEVLNAIREKLRDLGAVEIQTPKVVSTATEGGTDLFPIAYFEQEAFLNQSPQLYKQITINGLEKVFEIGPIFRAEEHNTPRHLNEAISIDFESAFFDAEDAMKACEDIIIAAYKRVESCQDLLDKLDKTVEVPKKPFERITYDEALEIASSEGIDMEWGEDLTTEAERYIGETIGEHYFIIDWPNSIKPFYVQPYGDSELSKAYDLLHPRMELMSGAKREHRYDELKKAIEKQGLNSSSFEFYLKAFRHGIPPHSGWGLGLERLLTTMLDLENVRQVVLFPRDRQRLKP